MRILLGVLRRIDYAAQMQRLVALVRGFRLPHVKDTDVYGVEEGEGRDSGLPVVAGLSPTAAGPNDGSYEKRWRTRAVARAASSGGLGPGGEPACDPRDAQDLQWGARSLI